MTDMKRLELATKIIKAFGPWSVPSYGSQTAIYPAVSTMLAIKTMYRVLDEGFKI